MAADVKIKDLGFTAIAKKAKALNGKAVRVGYQAGGPQSEGVDVLDVAIYTEYGTRNAPARPFMAQTASKNQPRVSAAMGRIANAATTGQGAPAALLGQLGEFYAELIRREISSGDFAANAPSTIRAKGSSKPLVDTGRVLAPAVRWVLE